MEVVCTDDRNAADPSESQAAAPCQPVIQDDAGREAFRADLRRRIGDQRFATWFGEGVSIAVRRLSAQGPHEARVTVGTPFEQSLIRKQFSGDLAISAQATLGKQAVVALLSSATPTPTGSMRASRKPSTKPTPAPVPVVASPAPPTASLHSRSPSPPAAKLGGWLSGPTNAAATRLCSRLAAGQPGPSPVLLWGPSGVGKSHLLRLVAEGGRARRRRVLSITAEQFLRGFVDAARGAGFPSFRQKHQGVDVLLVDDVQLLLGKRRTVEEFRQTIDSLIESGAQIILSADRGPNELRDLGPELASRLAGGLSVEITMPDAELRERLAVQAAQRIGLDLPETAAKALACHLLGGGREISGAIHRMALLHETFESLLDERLATQVANDTNRLSTPPIRLVDIQRAVCEVFEVDAKTLRSGKRTKAVSEPRTLAMFLAREKTGCPWSEIGDYFGRRSHSTVIAAHKRVLKLLASEEPKRLLAGELGETIRRVEAALRSA